MEVNSDAFDIEQNQIAERSLVLVIILLVIEIILVIITGFLFIKVILKPIRNLQTLLSDIVNSMPSVLIGVYNDGEIFLWNNKAESMTGLLEKNAKEYSLKEISPLIEVNKEEILKSINNKETITEFKKAYQMEEGVRYHDIVIYPLTGKGVSGAVIRIDDVTEKVRMEELVIQSEKMLSVGGLAAGMAHEINNPLAGLIQTAHIIGRRLGIAGSLKANEMAAESLGIRIETIQAYLEARDIPKMFENMDESGHRVADLVLNMLSFARQGSYIQKQVAIKGIVEKALDLAATDYNLKRKYDFRKIKIIREYEETVPSVPCDAIKIQQVFLNLFRNGAEAMDSAGVENPFFIIRIYYRVEDKMTCIEIEDNGPGIKEFDSKRIFEPFFTTKPIGKGTGLGLSVSYFIITENHKGQMKVLSKKDGGTTFIISLPLV
jgi:PAS domain S-box-containing protein